MSRTNRNFIIAYVVLVGLPMLGLMAVLNTGQRLRAPNSVDGVWKVETDISRLSSLPCLTSVSLLRNTSVVISQSGKSLVLSLDHGSKATASGFIEGNTLTASVLPPVEYASETGCGSDRLLTVSATLKGSARPRSLIGAFAVEGCASCPPVEFHAVWQGYTSNLGTH
jgi:hypothetical protein